MKLLTCLLLIVSAYAAEKSKVEKSENYTETPIVDFHYQVATRKITDLKKYKGKVFKVAFNQKRQQSIYDAGLLFSSKYGKKHALFIASGAYRGINLSIQVIMEIDPDGLYMSSSRVDEGYYVLKGVKTYKTVAGGENTVFIFDKYAGKVEKENK